VIFLFFFLIFCQCFKFKERTQFRFGLIQILGFNLILVSWLWFVIHCFKDDSYWLVWIVLSSLFFHVIGTYFYWFEILVSRFFVLACWSSFDFPIGNCSRVGFKTYELILNVFSSFFHQFVVFIVFDIDLTSYGLLAHWCNWLRKFWSFLSWIALASSSWQSV